MDDLITFINARLDDDQEALDEDDRAPEGAMRFVDADRWSEPIVSTFADVDRIRRDIAAKRAIVAEIDNAPAHYDGLSVAIKALAAVWSDHPDYQPEWPE